MNKTAFALLLAIFAASGLSAPYISAGPQDEGPPETELAKHMLVVKDAMRLLRRSVRKPDQRADSLASVGLCQQALLVAKGHEPVMTSSLPEAERAAFVRDFRLEMITTIETYLALERALLEERDDEARELYKKAAGSEDPAHERFTEGE